MPNAARRNLTAPQQESVMEMRHRLVMAPMDLAVALTDVCSSELTDIDLSTLHNEIPPEWSICNATAARRDVRPDQRVDQFIRLSEVIEERASRKFFEEQAQADRPVVLRSNDFIK
jgi:hypothetical protein